MTQWEKYIEYLKKWADDHKDETNAGMSPACLDEFGDFEEFDEEEEDV